MITCTLGEKKYTVDFVSGRALREMEPASKMYGRLVRLSQDATEGKDVSQEQLTVTDALDTMVKWFCILFNNQRFEPGAQDEIWEEMGLRIHGCDECQLACPRNHAALHAPKRQDVFLETLTREFDLEKVLELDEEYYETVVHPIMYNYIKDADIFRRNAAIAIGNSGDPVHLPALRRALDATDREPVRKAIAWAIKRLEQGEQTEA